MTVTIITGANAATNASANPVGSLTPPLGKKVIAPAFNPQIQPLGDQPDILVSTMFKDPIDCLNQGHRLNLDYAHYWEVLGTPVVSSSSTATTGGSLISGTYAARISAVNAAGESFASVEATQVVPAGTSTNTVTWNWGAVTGATSYKYYGRTSGAELLIVNTGNVLTYTDTGTITPAGALPTVNMAAHPKMAMATGPVLWPAFGPGTINGIGADAVVLDCQGVLPLDQWTLSFKVSPTTVDLASYPNTNLIQFVTHLGAAMMTVTVGAGTFSCILDGKAALSAIVAAAPPAQPTGKVPVGSWLTCVITYGGTPGTMILHTIAPDGTRKDSNPAGNVATSYTANDVPWFGQFILGNYNTAAAANIQIADFQVLRYNRTIGSERMAYLPTVTVAAGTTATGADAGALGGQLAVVAGTYGSQVWPNNATILNEIPGCGLFRVGDVFSLVPVTDTVTGAPRFTYDFTVLDGTLTLYAAAGKQVHVNLDYTPPALGPTVHGPPTSNTLYAQVCSDVVAHIQANFPNVIAFPFWNEPANFYTGTQSQFLATYQAVQAKLLATNGVALGGVDTYWSDPMYQAWVTYLQSNGLPAPATLHHHEYSGDPGASNTAAMRGALRAIKAAAIAAGFSSAIPLYVSEWNYDLHEATADQGGFDLGSLAQYTNFYQSSLMPAYAFAIMAEMDAEGVAGAMFTRLQTDSSVDLSSDGFLCLMTEDTPPRPQPIFAAFQPLWAMGTSQRVSAMSNEPGVYTMATKNANGQIVWAYGAYGHGPRHSRFDLSLVASGLPSTFTWQQWECSPDTIGDGRMRMIATGRQDTVPTFHRMWANSVGCLVITPP